MKKHNFSAGPCILPQEVIKKASEAIINFNKSNLSLIEISHRSNLFIEVIEKAKNIVKELLNMPNNYSILFLQGGASLEFLMAPYNLMKKNGTAAYLNTGTWSQKAIIEAKRFGHVDIIADSADKNFNYIPKEYIINSSYDYFHCTSNNTIYGTQIKKFPKCPTLMVCDMSSDIFSRKINVEDFDLIYAGAQKNMGPAGTTLVIIKNEILKDISENIPTMLNYNTHVDKQSMFNTPPVFAIYVSMLTLEWLKNIGGIDYIEKLNQKKAQLLYDEIDRNPYFQGTAHIDDRSNMNITFLLTDNNKEEEFDKLWKSKGINGLKGHRSVGGYRASIYNAMPISSIEVLIDTMQKLEKI